MKPNDDDAPRPEDMDADGVDPTETPEEVDEIDSMATMDSSIQQRPSSSQNNDASDGDEIDSRATMASGIHKRPQATPSHDLGEPELPATFTGEEVDEDDLSTIGAEYGNPFEDLGELPRNAPTEIAGFVVKGLIAQGGMGAVYLAMQRRPRRPVAIKVIKPGVASPMALKRFEFEAQMLARLTHPGIAQIYEAGTFDQGDGLAPFFAMEYVPNARLLDEYAKEHKLDARAKVKLMIVVCEAVGSGHAKGIIHRDLKPGNILVSSAGHPKIIDFGVARSTDSDQRVTMQTEVHAIVGTLQYMAPEQCAGDVLDLDTSADVYALGVALYELLTGQLPYEVSGGIATAIKMVTEARPDPISTFDKSFRGDLEIIVSKAMAKDRSDRYRTASELGDDLRRWIHDEPIMAQSPTMVTSLKRIVRRNKGLAIGIVAMVAVLGLAITGGVLALVNRNLVLATQNELLEEQSEKRAMVGDLITFFMRDSFDVIATLANSQEARESLVVVSLQYIEKLRDQAGGDPSLQRMLAEGLQQAGINEWSLQSDNRGNPEEAIANWEESLGIADALLEVEPDDTKALILAIRVRSLLENGYRRTGRQDDRLRVLGEAELMVERLPSVTTDPDQGRLAMGLLLDRSRLIPTEGNPEEDPAVKRMLAFIDHLQEAFPESEAIQRDATLAWARVAYAWNVRRDHERALGWYKRVLAVREDTLDTLGPMNTRYRDVMNAMRYVAQQLALLDRLDESIESYQRILPLARTLVVASPNGARARNDLARSLLEHGNVLVIADRSAEAIESLSESQIGWKQAMDRATESGSQDSLVARSLIQCQLLLTRAYLDTDNPQAARETVDHVRMVLRLVVKQWPQNDVFGGQQRDADTLHGAVLKELGRLD